MQHRALRGPASGAHWWTGQSETSPLHYRKLSLGKIPLTCSTSKQLKQAKLPPLFPLGHRGGVQRVPCLPLGAPSPFPLLPSPDNLTALASQPDPWVRASCGRGEACVISPTRDSDISQFCQSHLCRSQVLWQQHYPGLGAPCPAL